MKLLLEQQKEIYDNYKSTENAKESDLINALNQHLTEVVKHNAILPLSVKLNRVNCKDDKCNLLGPVKFDKIDGYFCPFCGYVFPF